MPTISEFYGIKISIYYSDHNEPHFHAFYAGEEAEISIKSGNFIEGNLPRRAKGMVMEWMKDHRDELLEDWNLAKKQDILKKIEPLS